MMTPLFLGKIGMSEILIVLLLVVLFFGGRKIPELMRGLGRGVREFKDAMNADPAAGKEEQKEAGEKPEDRK